MKMIKLTQKEIIVLKQVVKERLAEERENKWKHDFQAKEFKKMTCKKCGGIPVYSWVSSMAAKAYGKECRCK